MLTNFEEMREGTFTGWVQHTRRHEINHQFRYNIWMSLTELPNSSLPRLVRPRRSRYLDADRLSALTGSPIERVFLLTQPSLLGRSFNPVSFYFVGDKKRISHAVAHINNTPWDEHHAYVLPIRSGHWQFKKNFHVSPFLEMDVDYDWKFDISPDRVNIIMRVCKGPRTLFSAVMHLQSTPATQTNALMLRLKYPAQNLTNLIRIYWQAILLKLKGATFHAHPKHTDQPIHTNQSA